jgi:hypothetical protein
MSAYPTIEIAQQRAEQYLQLAQENLEERMTERVERLRGNYHPIQSIFTNAERPPTQAAINRINALRQQHGCPQ